MQAIYYSACCAFGLGKVFLIGIEPDCLLISRMSLFAQKFLPLCPTIFTGLFCEQLTSAMLVWVAMNVYIEYKLHGRGRKFNLCEKALILMPGSSKAFSADFRGILLYKRNQIVCLFSSSHSLIVYIAVLQFMPDCLYCIQGALSSNHNLLLLMAGVDHHDTCYSLPWFRWVPVIHSLCHHVYEWRRVQAFKWCVVCVSTSNQPNKNNKILACEIYPKHPVYIYIYNVYIYIYIWLLFRVLDMKL